ATSRGRRSRRTRRRQGRLTEPRRGARRAVRPRWASKRRGSLPPARRSRACPQATRASQELGMAVEVLITDPRVMTETRTDPIADGIVRISTYSPDGPPGGITYNQFVVQDDRPLLFHTGTARLFRATRAALASVIEPSSLRYISSGQSWPDDFGALDELLALAPDAEPVHGQKGCFLFLADLASRPPRALADGEVLDLGHHRMRWIDTPHVPFPWESGMFFDELTATL